MGNLQSELITKGKWKHRTRQDADKDADANSDPAAMAQCQLHLLRACLISLTWEKARVFLIDDPCTNQSTNYIVPV